MKNIFSKHKATSDGGCINPSQPIQDDRESTNRSQNSPEPDFPEHASNSRMLYVENGTSWTTHPKIRVFDSDKATELYTVATKCRKPQMSIQSVKTNTEVATVIYHAFKTRIDMTFHGQELSLASGGFLGVKYSYASPTLNGERVTWQPRKKLDDLNMVLLNGQGLAIARFKPNYMSWKQGGALEILTGGNDSDQMMEEVVVMALAVIRYKQSQRLASTTTSVVVTS